MRTDAQVLTLTQWLSPAFPIGSFAHSHGLEAAVERGWIRDATDFETWLNDVFESGAGRSDALVLAAAYHAPTMEMVAKVNATARAFAPSRERLLEAEAQGAAFCRIMNSVWGAGTDTLLYPVALGAAASREKLPLSLTSGMYLHAFGSNLIAAAQRLLPLGQTAGQAILRRLSEPCAAIAKATLNGELECLSSTAFLSDIASMKHETQRTRIFRT